MCMDGCAGEGQDGQPTMEFNFAVGWCLLWETLHMGTMAGGVQVGALLADRQPNSKYPAGVWHSVGAQ